ncbi:MAG: MCE family protein [Solirubrobacteraceae bacterium]|nr:MCE family protein [Solirubrobacteraceae bacterium]
MSSAVGGRKPSMSPTLLGSIAVLIVVITTFLAYNANNGLPWVPSKSLTVEVKDAANIVPGNEVRIGGTRVGIVGKTTAKQYPDGRTTALLELKLDANTQPIPVKTTVLIRARSLLGLKYVQLTPVKSDKKFEWGSSVPLANSTPDPVEVDQLLNTFDDPTRAGIVEAVTNFGDALAGRGSIIGQLIDDAGPLSENIVPVAKVLADDQDGLVPFLTSLTRFTTELAGSGDSLGGLFRGLDRTTGALARADAELDQTLQIAPEALTSSANSLRVTRGAIGPHIELARVLRPSFENIRQGSSDLADATGAAVRSLGDTPRFARDLTSVLTQLDAVSKSTVVARGLDGLTQFTSSAAPLVTSLSQAQRQCSYLSLLFRNLGSATFDGNKSGNWLRVYPYLPTFQPNGEGLPAASPLNGLTGLPAGAYAGASTTGIRDQRQAATPRNAYLYSNPAPVTGQGGQCGPGYETRPAWSDDKQQQKLTIGGSAASSSAFRPAPPKGSEFRSPSLDKATEDSDE